MRFEVSGEKLRDLIDILRQAQYQVETWAKKQRFRALNQIQKWKNLIKKYAPDEYLAGYEKEFLESQ